MNFNSKKLQQKSPILIVSEDMDNFIICKTLLDQVYDFNSSLKFSSMLDHMPKCLFIGNEQNIINLNIPNEFKKLIKMVTTNSADAYEEINKSNNISLDLVIQVVGSEYNSSPLPLLPRHLLMGIKNITDLCRKKQIPIINIGESQTTPLGKRFSGGSHIEFFSNTIYNANLSKDKLSFTLIKDRMGSSSDFELPLLS